MLSKRYKSTEVDRRTWLHVPSGTPSNDKLGQVLQSLQEVLKVLGQMDTNDGSYNGGYRKVVCYGCHEEGHIQKNCPLSRQTDRLQCGQETCARNTDRNEPLNAQGLGQ